MIDSRDSLAALIGDANKEITRLGRTEEFDARAELRFRVWPFLVELAETLEALFDDADAPETIPVDLIARTVGLLLHMANRLNGHLSANEMNELAARAATITEELMALCDPDELARYAAPDGSPEPVFDAELVEPVSPSPVLDTTARVIESDQSAGAGGATATEDAKS